MKTLTTTTSVLLLFFLSFSSCKKDRNVQTEHPLNGNWEEMDLTGFKRSLNFGKDNSFFLTIAYNDGGSTKFIGTYQIQSNKLNITTTEMLEQQPGKPVQKTKIAGNHSFFENATFSITGDTLKLNYITYPADAPVITSVKFLRLITIDN